MDWKERLKERGVLVSDGAWGTELAKLGLPGGAVTELWNAEHPELVERVARGYVDAGSDIILTNTFGGSRMKLARAGHGDRVAELNRLGVEISRRAAAGRAFVFASIGPTGEMLEPLGPRTEAEMIDCFAEQIAACAEAGADLLVTGSALFSQDSYGRFIEEMTGLARAMKEVRV
jgi:5-methyltetrahydrofolate--homocysteine methyltransferase